MCCCRLTDDGSPSPPPRQARDAPQGRDGLDGRRRRPGRVGRPAQAADAQGRGEERLRGADPGDQAENLVAGRHGRLQNAAALCPNVGAAVAAGGQQLRPAGGHQPVGGGRPLLALRRPAVGGLLRGPRGPLGVLGGGVGVSRGADGHAAPNAAQHEVAQRGWPADQRAVFWGPGGPAAGPAPAEHPPPPPPPPPHAAAAPAPPAAAAAAVPPAGLWGLQWPHDLAPQ